MTLGIKLLVGCVSLATASCGGYVIYKKVSSSGEEKEEVAKEEKLDNQGETGADEPSDSNPKQPTQETR